MSAELQKAWVCTICGYVHYGPEPPEECPVCGAEADKFELEVGNPEEFSAAGSESEGLRIIIVGAGIGGVSAAEASRQAAPASIITLISNEQELPYYRLNLTRYLAGELMPEELMLHPIGWYEENRIQLRRDEEVTDVLSEQKVVQLKTGEQIPYDRLILANGSHPFVPPVPGAQLGKVFSLRTHYDADSILRHYAENPVVCIGGGLLGLETAGALARRGARVTVLEAMNWLMPRQLNQQAAGIFQAYIERLGIQVLTGVKVKELQGTTDVQAVLLEDGTLVPSGLVIFSAGVRSNIALPKAAGLTTNLGVLVDDSMRTSVNDIYAAGDVTEHAGVLYGTWSPAQAQGNIAGTAAAGRSAAFRRVPPSAVLKVLGIELFSAGRISANPGDVLIESSGTEKYRGFLFTNGIPVGAILLGDTTGAVEVKKAIENSLNCSALLADHPNTDKVLEFLVKSGIA